MNLKNIENWEKRYKEQLDKFFLPFWTKKQLDLENKGYYTCIDKYGNTYSTDKSVWFQGRTAYIFSLLYNTYDKNPDFLEISKSCLEFMDEHCFDIDKRMFFTVNKEGKPIRKRRYYFSETFYIIAAAEYYKATNEKRYLNQAKEVFEMIYNIYCDEKNDPFKITPKVYASTRAYKTLGPSMILLNVIHTLETADKENESYYQNIIDKLLKDISCFYNPANKMILENVYLDNTFDFEFPEGRHQNPGHAIETSWFLMNEYQKNPNEELLKMALDFLDFSLEAGWDKENGGIKYFTDCLNYPVVELEANLKLWWPHNEAMIATLFAYKITKNKKYYDWFEKVSEFALTHFTDKEDKEWYGYLTYKNEISSTYKGSFYKGPFHYPRCLLKVLELLNEIK